MPKVVAVTFDDQDGLLTNVSNLLLEVRKGNVAGLFLCFERKDANEIRSYCFGIKGDRLEAYNLLLDVAKADLLTDTLRVKNSKVWGGKEEEE